MPAPLSRRAYIEPAIRTIAGGLIVVLGALVYWQPQWTWLWLLALLFLGINLFQSGLTKFCMMEKLLKKLDFRSELDEIRKLSEANAEAQARAAFFDTLALLNEVVVELTADARLAFMSEHWMTLLGRAGDDPAAHLGSPLSDFLHPQDRALVTQRLDSLLETAEPVSLRFRMLRDDHREHWVEGKFALYRQHGRLQGIRGVLRDITEAYVQERRISHMAMHDALTGLPNRSYLDEQLKRAIALASEHGTKFALLFLDLDNFKRVNDLHGHKTGDQLLASVSALLRGNLRHTDVVARWGGDEFVVLLPFNRDDDIPRKVASELMLKLQIELESQYANCYVTLSVGIAVYPTDADTAENLLIQADKALFYAKAQGRNNIQTCADLASGAPGFGEAEMASRLVSAIKQNQLQVYYQPVMDAMTPGRVRGVEALARWHDEKYGWVSPASFIPMAEDMGLINELGRYVLEQALEHFGSCNGPFDDLKLAVNVSKRQLMSADFYPTLLELMHRYGVRPPQVKLEITESIALEGIDKARTYLQRLSDAGFTLSLDDFGTGFSSLSHLHELPFDEIKIDISFVRRIKTAEGRVLVKTIADMGHAMQLSLVAEGVEDAETVAILRDLGVQMLQGYHFSRPMTKEACAKFVAGLQMPQLVSVAAG
ncbi:MAG: putative bifunctional diguanylate cyclase/phosphodiesterase [Thiobacillus sp.]